MADSGGRVPGRAMRAEVGCGADRQRRQGAERREGAGRADASGGRVWGGPIWSKAGCGAGHCDRRQGAGRADTSGGRVHMKTWNGWRSLGRVMQ